MNEIFTRLWQDITARLTGPMHLRLIIQPTCRNDPRGSWRAARRTSKSTAFPLGGSLERGPAARIVAAGVERCGKGFRRSRYFGRGLPTHRPQGSLHAGIADYRGDLSDRPIHSVPRPNRPHRKNGYADATKPRISAADCKN